MKHIFWVSLTIMFSFSSSAIALESITPRQIAQAVYDREIGNNQQLKGTMKLISKGGHIRTRQYISYRKDDQGHRSQLIRFTEPADIKGTGFLTLEHTANDDTEQHLYLPALKRTRRIVSSQKDRSFVNSDFTYEDMQRQPVKDWDYQRDPDEEILNEPCYVLTRLPLKNTETQYSKVKNWVSKRTFMPLKTIFWDKKNREAKRYQVNQYEIIDGISTEIDILMIDLKSDHKTQLISEQVRYNNELNNSIFTTRYLNKW